MNYLRQPTPIEFFLSNLIPRFPRHNIDVTNRVGSFVCGYKPDSTPIGLLRIIETREQEWECFLTEYQKP